MQPVRRRLNVDKLIQKERGPGFGAEDSLLAGVHWSPAYIAFLVYVFVITTYRVQIGTAAMSVALVLLPLERKPLRFPSPLLWMLAFLGWGFVGWGSSQYPSVVWDSLIELAKVCGVVFVAINVLTNLSRVRFFLLAFLGFFAFYPVRGALFSYFIYHGATQGRAAWNYIYSNPNDLAGLCLLPLAFTAGMLVTERRAWVRYCAIAGAIALPFVILLTQSRGATIALAAFALMVLRRQKRRRGAILLLVGAIGIAIFFAAPASTWKRLGTFSEASDTKSFAEEDAENSARQRLELWRVARTIAEESPITGIGLGAYKNVHYLYAQRPVFDPIALGYRDAHSTYLTLLAETGVVGFALFMMMMLTTIRDAERTRRRAVLTLPGRALQITYMEVGLFGYFIAGIWGSFQMLVMTYLYVAVLYAMTQVLKEDLDVPQRAGSESHKPLTSGRRFARRVAV